MHVEPRPMPLYSSVPGRKAGEQTITAKEEAAEKRANDASRKVTAKTARVPEEHKNSQRIDKKNKAITTRMIIVTTTKTAERNKKKEKR